MGNILGRIGSGKTVIMMDSHTDTVGVGDPKEWGWDPYQGKVEDGYIYGRGPAISAPAWRAWCTPGKLIKELGLRGDYTVYMVGSVQEEDCDGLCWLYILKEDGIRPDCVVITEPTRLGIYRGHRGRMEIEVHLRGKSCHASAPERGDNPIYKMSRLVAGSGEAEHAAERRSVPGQGHDRGDGDPLAFAIAVRGAGRVLDPPGPAVDGGRDQRKRGGRGARRYRARKAPRSKS